MSDPPKKPLHILLLEDSPLDAELILSELKHAGVEFISNRVQRREDYEREIIDFHPDLILADYRLPSFDGGQALEIAKEFCTDVPVIIISGAVGEETAVELLKNGATDFVLKDRLAGRLVPVVLRALREVAQRDARRKAEADLLQLNAELEQRVADRTRELQVKNDLMEEDLKMAHELQMTFLPGDFPTLPRGASKSASAVKFGSAFYPAGNVSGDFYNVVRVSDTAVGIFICDVMGHGVRAALVTAMMRALEEQLGNYADDPGAFLTRMNRSLRGVLGQLGASLFTTACYVIADVAKARVIFANAGHPSPYLLRDANGEIEALNDGHPAGPALGLIDEVVYSTHELPVDEGDQILVFTNGLFLAENPNDEPFGSDRLRESIRQRAGLPVNKLIQDVASEIERFAEGRPFADDICLVGMEISRLLAGAAVESGDGLAQAGEHRN